MHHCLARIVELKGNEVQFECESRGEPNERAPKAHDIQPRPHRPRYHERTNTSINAIRAVAPVQWRGVVGLHDGEEDEVHHHQEQ